MPLLTSECSPTSRRGFVVSSAYIFTVTGVLTAYIVDFAVTLTHNTDWRWMVGASIFPSTLLLILVCLLPESPRVLVAYVTAGRLQILSLNHVRRRFRFTDANKVLQRLRGVPDVDDELLSIIKGMFSLAPEKLTIDALIDGVDPVTIWKSAGHDGENAPLVTSTDSLSSYGTGATSQPAPAKNVRKKNSLQKHLLRFFFQVIFFCVKLSKKETHEC